MNQILKSLAVNLTKLLFALFCIALLGCQRESPKKPVDINAVSSATEIPLDVLEKIKSSGANIRQLQGTDSEGNAKPASGVTFDVPNSKALSAVQDLQKKLGKEYFVFISDRNYGIGGRPDYLSVLKTADPYEAIKTFGTNGWNYDVSPEAIIKRLKKWDSEFGLKFHGVGFDWIEATFRTQPKDMQGFAKEVYAFCPDVVDQGTETVEALAEEMKKSNSLYLWWD